MANSTTIGLSVFVSFLAMPLIIMQINSDDQIVSHYPRANKKYITWSGKLIIQLLLSHPINVNNSPSTVLCMLLHFLYEIVIITLCMHDLARTCVYYYTCFAKFNKKLMSIVNNVAAANR